MLTLTQLPNTTISIKTDYYYKDRIKKIPGARFDYDTKEWIIDFEMLDRLESEFQGELVYKTPRWIIKNEPIPDSSKMYQFHNNNIDVPPLKLNPYDYQNYGIKFMIDRILKQGFVLNADDVGLGKCHGKGTEILMYDGTIKKVEDIIVGEQLMGDDGTPRNVLSLARGREKMYKIHLSNGDSFVCNESHILSMKSYDTCYENFKHNQVVNISVKDFLNLPSHVQKDVLKAYKVGLADTFGYDTNINVDAYTYGLSIIDCKINDNYKYATKDTRLKLLAGILDKNALITNNGFELRYTNDDYKEDVLFICRSLGFNVRLSNYKIVVNGNLNSIPTKLKSLTFFKQNKEDNLIYDIKIELLGVDNYYGFALDGNHLYLLGDFTVTHNTIQTIATMKWFIDNEHIKKLLVICKKSIKSQWIDEINKFTNIGDEFELIKTESLAKKRKKAYEQFNDADKAILVTNYHSFLNDTHLFEEMDIDFVVIDEVHSVKARSGILNNNIGSITNGKPTVFLTGTPIMSKPEDIFGIVQMVDASYFGLWTKFQKEYLTIDLYGKFGPRIVGAKHLDELRQKVQDIVIRRTEYEVSIQLPKTIINKIDCDMDSVQENLLRSIQSVSNDITDTVDDLKANKKPSIEELEKIAKLEAKSKGLIAARQAATTDPRLFLRSYSKMMKQEFGKLVPKNYKMSNKIESVIDLVEDILGSDDKVILFTKFRTCAQMVAEDIESKLKEKVLLYTGGENDDDRDKAIYNFKNTSSYNILIGTEAMAEGLNLQCAKYVINIDQPDTFAIKTQRIGRARRTGSNFDHVIVYDMITESKENAKSKDEERLNNILKNRDVTDALVSIDESQRKALIEAMQKE